MMNNQVYQSQTNQYQGQNRPVVPVKPVKQAKSDNMVFIVLVLGLAFLVLVFVRSEKLEDYIWAINKKNQIEAVDGCMSLATISDKFNKELYKMCMQEKGY